MIVARNTASAVAIALVLVIAVLGFDATVCFGGDGHVAVDARAVDHHVPAPRTSAVDSSLGTDATGHGPCTDSSLVSVETQPPLGVDIAADTAAVAPVAPGSVRTALTLESSADHPRSAPRNTVLRI